MRSAKTYDFSDGLPAADARGPLACGPCPRACRINISGGTNFGAGQHVHSCLISSAAANYDRPVYLLSSPHMSCAILTECALFDHAISVLQLPKSRGGFIWYMLPSAYPTAYIVPSSPVPMLLIGAPIFVIFRPSQPSLVSFKSHTEPRQKSAK